MQNVHTVLLVSLLQASNGVLAATPYGVITLVELPVDNVRLTPGGPVLCNESLYIQAYILLLKMPETSSQCCEKHEQRSCCCVNRKHHVACRAMKHYSTLVWGKCKFG